MKTVAYTCYNLDENIRLKSSSGGLYFLIAKEIISMGGIVFAACYNDKLQVEHRRIDCLEDIEASCGSKYVESNIGNTFVEIKRELKNNKKVLFAGTPCQCAGLLSFAGENDNLYCIDIVCHGVPSKLVWEKYLNELKENGFETVKVNMRDKVSGWTNGSYSWSFQNVSGQKMVQRQRDNIYMKGYIANLFSRPSCYECKFKGIDRKTDFTLGDFWGVEKIQPEMNDNKGTSLLFIHSQKGNSLFENICKSIKFATADVDRAIEYNKCIIESVQLTNKRKKFFDSIEAGKRVDKTVEKLVNKSLLQKLKMKIKKYIKRKK